MLVKVAGTGDGGLFVMKSPLNPGIKDQFLWWEGVTGTRNTASAHGCIT